MKMKRIANDLAFQTLGYLISGTQEIEVYYRVDGYRKETVFEGKYVDFRKDQLFGSGDEVSHNKVTAIGADGNVLRIGIDR